MHALLSQSVNAQPVANLHWKSPHQQWLRYWLRMRIQRWAAGHPVCQPPLSLPLQKPRVYDYWSVYMSSYVKESRLAAYTIAMRALYMNQTSCSARSNVHSIILPNLFVLQAWQHKHRLVFRVYSVTGQDICCKFLFREVESTPNAEFRDSGMLAGNVESSEIQECQLVK